VPLDLAMLFSIRQIYSAMLLLKKWEADRKKEIE